MNTDKIHAQWERAQDIREAIPLLKRARNLLRHADTPMTLAKLRSTIKSAEGALRHADGIRTRLIAEYEKTRQ